MTGTILGGFTGRAVSGVVAADVSWQAAFVVLAILTGGVATVLTMRLPPEPAKPPSRQTATGAGHGSIGRLVRNRRLVATCGVGFSVLFTQVAMFTYVTFHLAAPPFALSTVALGWLFVVYLVGAVVTPFAGRWNDAYGHRTGIASAMAIGGAGALITLVPWLPAIVAGLALCATGVFAAQATTSSYIGAVTTEDRALAVGMYSTFYYAAAAPAGRCRRYFWSAEAGRHACCSLSACSWSARRSRSRSGRQRPYTATSCCLMAGRHEITSLPRYTVSSSCRSSSPSITSMSSKRWVTASSFAR